MKKIARIVLVVFILLGAWFLYATKNPQLPISQTMLTTFGIHTTVQSDLTGQVIADTKSTGATAWPIGLANPASVNCEKNWWTVEIVTQADGSQIGMCHLPDGTVCEERAYFRHECWANIPATWTDSGNDRVACSMIYMPVCASVQVECIKAPCPPIEQTFSSLCVMKSNPLAVYLHDGECTKK